MEKTDITGGPAFPTVNYAKPGGELGTSIMTIKGGMTIRDWFAASAMEAFMSSKTELGSFDEEPLSWYEKYARHAYLYADAMLKERSK